MSHTAVKLNNTRRHASDLLDLLVDTGPLTSAEICEQLEWSAGRFTNAVRYARDELCVELGLTIPAATPPEWLYQVTTDWEPVEIGASYTLGLVERRLGATLRDVDLILPHLTRGSREWRRANFLSKHLSNILGTLTEINDG